MPDEIGSRNQGPDPLTYEARLEAVLEAISDAFYALDRDWTMVVSFPRSGAICEMSAPLEAVVARP